MSEFKGTHGVWEIRPTAAVNKNNKPLYYDIVVNGSGFVSTHKNIYIIGGMTDEQQFANAKLISCAPEMFELLKVAKLTISRLKNSMQAHPDCVEHSEFKDYINLGKDSIHEIESLIKKATEL